MGCAAVRLVIGPLQANTYYIANDLTTFARRLCVASFLSLSHNLTAPSASATV